jgi:hypothetical protein
LNPVVTRLFALYLKLDTGSGMEWEVFIVCCHYKDLKHLMVLLGNDFIDDGVSKVGSLLTLGLEKLVE